MRSVRYATVATTSQVTAVHHGAFMASARFDSRHLHPSDAKIPCGIFASHGEPEGL